MRPHSRLVSAGTAVLLAACTATEEAPVRDARSVAWTYPEARRGDVVDDYHGVAVPDPYRWMEDLDAQEVADWVAANNRLAADYLEGAPGREAIRRRLTELWDHEEYSLPYKRGGRYFYARNDGLQDHYVLYVTESLEGEPRVLLDPNLLSEDGTIALSALAISHDGKRAAYGLSEAGSDWIELRVLDVDTGEHLDDHLKWIKFSNPAWTRDGLGFFYCRFDPPVGGALVETNSAMQLCYHRLGTPQSEDEVIYHRPDRETWIYSPQTTDDGRYLIVTIMQRNELKSRVYYMNLAAANGELVALLDDHDAYYGFAGNEGPLFWFQTDLAAVRWRLLAVDTRHPERASWAEVIPEAEGVLTGVSVVGDRLVASYEKDVHTEVKIFEKDGRFVRDVELPGLGTAAGFQAEPGDTETFYVFTSFTAPITIHRYDVASGEGSVYRRPEIDFDPEAFVTRQVFYESRDGTRVPLFVTHRKDLVLDGANPTCLSGYGGGHLSVLPYFSVVDQVWMERGGVCAVANIRGGGEYGMDWYNAGRLKNKQNCFDDFIAATEWLIANDYTRPERLAIAGGSNGGTLVGACLTQRPELFGACLPDAGVMDMLRFPEFTIGWAWISEYGDPQDPEMFAVLHAYSPLHNVRPGTVYPATLVLAADHDDRVVPSHSYKFTAALQAAQAGAAPILLRVDTRAGHGAGKPTAMQIEAAVDRWAFLERALGVSAPE